MKNKTEILEQIKYIKDIITNLRLKINVIEKEEYKDKVNKADKALKRLEELINE